jgi:hypothetical protein
MRKAKKTEVTNLGLLIEMILPLFVPFSLAHVIKYMIDLTKICNLNLKYFLTWRTVNKIQGRIINDCAV